MEREKSDDETLDRLSELPESLILQILSFLKMRDVVRTSLLSKRWKNLWTTTPYLNFDESGKNPVQTRAFINGVLLRWKGTRILRFKIRFGEADDVSSLSGDIDIWVGFATEREVEDLCLRLHYVYRKPSVSNPVYLPPHCLYSCSSITKLRLVGYNLQIPESGSVQWCQLKSLRIHGYCMSEDAINQVVSSAPHLEILSVRLFGTHQSFSIQSSRLKELKIVKYKYLRSVTYDPSNYTELTIRAPKLEALRISGAAYSKCLLMDVKCLTAATLGFADTCDVAVGETLRQILPTIQHVEALTLSPCCFRMLGIGVRQAKYLFSSFPNVKILKFSGGPIEPNEIVGVAEIFPKVEKLVIDWKLDAWFTKFLANLSQKQDIGDKYAKNLKPFMMQLRTVEVTLYNAASIFQLIKFLLKHATMLQRIVIKKGRKSRNRVVKSKSLALATQELISLQSSFPALDLIFYKK